MSTSLTTDRDLVIRPAVRADLALVLTFIRELAEYERMADDVVATEERLDAALFGERRVAEAVIAELDGAPVGFALFFANFSTFLALPGIYLEDLFVRPAARGRGVGRALLAHLARLAVERGGGRLEWAVLIGTSRRSASTRPSARAAWRHGTSSGWPATLSSAWDPSAVRPASPLGALPQSRNARNKSRAAPPAASQEPSARRRPGPPMAGSRQAFRAKQP